jgi:hypothetical protein
MAPNSSFNPDRLGGWGNSNDKRTAPLATPGIETIEMIEANAQTLKQFGAVEWSLAWA